MSLIDVVEQVGLVAFALSAVLALRGHDVDVVGIMTLGVVTAIGGGTVRDLLLDEPVFWIEDPATLIVPAVAGLVGFATIAQLARIASVIELLDALGLAVFSVAGASIALDAGARPGVAVIMGVTTATAGGALRDVLADRPTLLMGRNFYVTPALVGAAGYVLIVENGGSSAAATGVGAGAALTIRSLAVLFDLSMPSALTLDRAETSSD